MLEQDLKDTFTNALFLVYKLLVISNRDMTLGEMMDVLFKKEACIKKIYEMCSKKYQIYEKKVKNPKNDKKPKVNNVDKRNNKPHRKLQS